MAILPIRMAGDPVLRQKARKVKTIDASVQKLIDNMIETMIDAPGVGLAANQVGVLLRVIVIQVPEREQGRRSSAPGRDEAEEEDEEREVQWKQYVLINPQVVKRSGERRLDEGCLSVPGYKALVPRSMSVTVKGLDRDGKEIRIKAEDDLLAEALEHEIDHINGILYVDHLDSIDELVKLEDQPQEASEAKASASRSSA